MVLSGTVETEETHHRPNDSVISYIFARGEMFSSDAPAGPSNQPNMEAKEQ